MKGVAAFAIMFAIIFVAPRDADAGELKSLKLDSQHQKILGGRLLVRLPTEAKVEEKQGHSNYPVLQSRITVSAGGDEVYILAQELLQLAPNSFEEEVKKMAPGGTDAKIERLEVDSGDLRVYAVWPQQISAGAEANLLLTLFIARRDRSVQLVTFFINGAAAADAGGARVFAKRISRSLGAGDKSLGVRSGPTTLSSPSGNSVRVTLPKNSVITREKVTDELVQYTVHRMTTLGTPHPGNLGVQLGGDVELRYKRFGADATSQDGSLAGERTEWYAWEATFAGGQLTSVLEATAQPRVRDGILPIHVYLMADDSDEIVAWRGVARTVEVAR